MIVSASTVEIVTVATDDVSPDVIAALVPRLTTDERGRMDRLVRETDRHTFTLARALVRQTLSAHGPTAAEAWRFETNRYGCPFVVEAQAGTPRLHFNLSHTAGLVALAVTRGHDLGVDVERADRVVRERIAERHFAPQEVRDLLAMPEDAQPQAFFEYWTLKEAYIKARGMGLAIPLGDFAFRLRPPARPTIAFVDGFDDTPARWQFWQAWPTPHHRLALAVTRDGADLDVRLTALPPEALAR